MRVKLPLAIVVTVASISLSFADNIKDKLSEHVAIPFASQKKSAEHEGGEANAAVETGGEEHGEVEHGEAEHGGEEHGAAEHGGEEHHAHKIVVTCPEVKDVVITQQYVCQIHSRRHIEICALEGGYLQEICVNEGAHVKQGDLMFKILPTLYQARLDADVAEAQLAQVEYDNTNKLVGQGIVSDQELKLASAKLVKANARVDLARAELNFAEIRAPFDGIIDRYHEQQGSLIEEGSMLTTLSDNQVMWVYFNVPEARYFEYQEALKNDPTQHDLDIELLLANKKMFSQSGKIGAIEADFNSETGNIAFRADFPNPDGLLRHGQTGTVLINRVSKNATVIPQRATYEILAKKYVYVVDDNNVIHQREIVIQNEMDDVFVIGSGLEPNDKIVLEGIRQVRDGDQVDYEFRETSEVFGNLKYHAE